jgi:hypothetical protein
MDARRYSTKVRATSRTGTTSAVRFTDTMQVIDFIGLKSAPFYSKNGGFLRFGLSLEG